MNSPRPAILSPIRDHAELVSAIDALHASLRVLDCGIEPDLSLHLNEIARIADYGRAHLPGALVVHCRELETRLWELACCDVPASIEDYDVFLQLLGRIELAAMAGGGVHVGTPEPLPLARRSGPRTTRLVAHPTTDGLTLEVPETEAGADLDRLLEDLTVLWEISPCSAAWTVDCTASRRVPLALLAHLIDLRLLDGDTPRRMRILGLDHGLRSPELGTLLGAHFDPR